MKRIRVHESDGPTSVIIRTKGGIPMKYNYIKKVKRALVCGTKQKKLILCDLEEIFSSAAEHGQTDEEVIARLGSPREFAAATQEQLGVDRKAVLRRRALLTALPSALLALLFFILYRIAYPFGLHEQASIGIIGGADGPTSILITTSPASPAAVWTLLGACILCAGIAITALLSYLLKSKK